MLQYQGLELSQLVEIHYQMAEVCEAYVMSWKQVWIWYNAINKGRAHADGKQKPICSRTSIVTFCVMQVPLSQSTGEPSSILLAGS
jgi:hypothetical protein